MRMRFCYCYRIFLNPFDSQESPILNFEEFNVAVVLTNQVMADPGAGCAFMPSFPKPVGLCLSWTRVGLSLVKHGKRMKKATPPPSPWCIMIPCIHHSQVAIFWHTSPPLGSCCERAVESNALPRSTIRPAFLRARASLRSIPGASGMVVIESEKASRDGPKGIRRLCTWCISIVLTLACLQFLKWRAMVRAKKAWVFACSVPANSASKSWHVER